MYSADKLNKQGDSIEPWRTPFPVLNMLLSDMFYFSVWWASLVVQTVQNPPAVWETWVRSLGWEDPLGEGMAPHSSILAWRISMDRSLAATVLGVRVRQGWTTKHMWSLFPSSGQWWHSMGLSPHLASPEFYPRKTLSQGLLTFCSNFFPSRVSLTPTRFHRQFKSVTEDIQC